MYIYFAFNYQLTTCSLSVQLAHFCPFVLKVFFRFDCFYYFHTNTNIYVRCMYVKKSSSLIVASTSMAYTSTYTHTHKLTHTHTKTDFERLQFISIYEPVQTNTHIHTHTYTYLGSHCFVWCFAPLYPVLCLYFFPFLFLFLFHFISSLPVTLGTFQWVPPLECTTKSLGYLP